MPFAVMITAVVGLRALTLTPLSVTVGSSRSHSNVEPRMMRILVLSFL